MRTRDIAIFAVMFGALSLGLGWVFFASTSVTLGVSMLAVPVASAMLAARGFLWRRKLVYSAATIAVYVAVNALAGATGFTQSASAQVNGASTFPSFGALFYVVLLTTFPLAMLVLFVGRHPRRLWCTSD